MAEKMVSLNASRTMMERVRLFVESLVSETANLIPTKTSDLTNDDGFITEVEPLSDSDIDDAIANVFGLPYIWTIKMNNAAAVKLSDEAGNEVHIWKYASSDSVSVDSTAPDADGPIGDPFTYTLDRSSISFVPNRLSVYGVGRRVEVSVIAEIVCDSETFLSYTPGEDYADILDPSQDVSFEITMAVAGAV